MATMKSKPDAARPTASRILFRRFFEGNPKAIAELEQARRELSLGDRLRAMREARGLSQAQLAELADTSPSAISRMEQADYDSYTIKSIKKVAAALDCHIGVVIVDDSVSA